VPIGIISSGVGTGTTTGIGRPWTDDGSVPAHIYVNNVIGDDDNFDGTSPTIGAGTIGPYASIIKAINSTPVDADIYRIIHVAGTGVKYIIPNTIEALNWTTIEGDYSIEASWTITSINSSTRTTGLRLTVGSGMTPDAHRGKIVKFTSGTLNNQYGVIYKNSATDIWVTQDTHGQYSFRIPSVGNTLDVLTLDTEIDIDDWKAMVACAQSQVGFRFMKLTGDGTIFNIATDQVIYQYCQITLSGRWTAAGIGRGRLQTSYIANGGSDAVNGMMSSVFQSHLSILQGTVVDGINATNDHIRSVSQSSWETSGEVVFIDVGLIKLNGTQISTPRKNVPGDNTWRFIDCAGITGNAEDECSWGHWDLPTCYGNVTGTYFLTGTKGVWGRIPSGSSVATTGFTNAVSADDGATLSADNADYTHFEGGYPAGVGNPFAPSSIEGVSNYGGNIDLVPADSITITGVDATDEIIIGESHSGDTSNPHGSKQIKSYVLNLDFKVPASGIGFLYLGDVATSAAPLVVNATGTLRGAAIGVDTADSKNYALEVLKNSSVVETLSLPSGSSEASTIAFTTSVVANDKISVRLRRTSGSGKSDFNDVTTYIEILES
jgi:hypothetical protein